MKHLLANGTTHGAQALAAFMTAGLVILASASAATAAGDAIQKRPNWGPNVRMSPPQWVTVGNSMVPLNPGSSVEAIGFSAAGRPSDGEAHFANIGAGLCDLLPLPTVMGHFISRMPGPPPPGGALLKLVSGQVNCALNNVSYPVNLSGHGIVYPNGSVSDTVELPVVVWSNGIVSPGPWSFFFANYYPTGVPALFQVGVNIGTVRVTGPGGTDQTLKAGQEITCTLVHCVVGGETLTTFQKELFAIYAKEFPAA